MCTEYLYERGQPDGAVQGLAPGGSSALGNEGCSVRCRGGAPQVCPTNTTHLHAARRSRRSTLCSDGFVLTIRKPGEAPLAVTSPGLGGPERVEFESEVGRGNLLPAQHSQPLSRQEVLPRSRQEALSA